MAKAVLNWRMHELLTQNDASLTFCRWTAKPCESMDLEFDGEDRTRGGGEGG